MKKITGIIITLTAGLGASTASLSQTAPVPPAAQQEDQGADPARGQLQRPQATPNAPASALPQRAPNGGSFNGQSGQPNQPAPTPPGASRQFPPAGSFGGSSTATPPANNNSLVPPPSPAQRGRSVNNINKRTAPPEDTAMPDAGTDSGTDANGVSAPSGDVPEVRVEIPEKKGAEAVPPGQELVSIHFPEPTEIKDIIKAVSYWTGKNVILGEGGIKGKVQIISPNRVTKEEAYQSFLSALNLLRLTTVETGKVIKIMQINEAVKGNLKTFMGSDWTPRTDEVITQIIPLKYIDATAIKNTLSTMVNARSGSMIAYEPTNTLIISDSGYKIRSILDIIKLIDVQGQQPQVSIVPIRYADAKDVADKVNEILKSAPKGGVVGSPGGGGYTSFKIIVDERSNSVAVFGPPRTIADVKELVKKFDIHLDDPMNQSTIHVRPLDYADAKKLAATLSALANGGASNTNSAANRMRRFQPPGSPPTNMPAVNAAPEVAKLDDNVKITADDSSNSLLITGSRSAYNALNTIIRKLDVRRSQVFVESDILDVLLNDDFSFGISAFAGYTSDKVNGPISWQGDKGMAGVVLGTSAAALDTAAGTAAALGALNTAFAKDLTIGILSSQPINIPGIGDVTPGALVKMLKADGNTKQLASPQILTANNEEANITVGESKYFKVNSDPSPTTGISTTSTRKVDANLALTVKPNISHSNYVTLDIKIEADSLSPTAVGDLPSVNTRKSNQIVTVKNKQTIVVSGLIKNLERESFDKIPLLGDIPLLGWLFRNTSKEKSQSNLMMFMTPYIVHGADDLADIYATKRAEADEFFYKVYGRSFKKTPFYSSVPSLEDGRYVEDPIDRMEQERRNSMLKEMHDAASSESGGRVGRNYDIDSSPTTVPGSALNGGGHSTPIQGGGVSPQNNGGDYQPIEPREQVDPPESIDPPDTGGGDE